MSQRAWRGLGVRSQNIHGQPFPLQIVEETYYTHFVLADDEAAGYTEFSGVVRVMRYGDAEFETEDVQRLLAEDLECEADDVTVLQWSRLH